MTCQALHMNTSNERSYKTTIRMQTYCKATSSSHRFSTYAITYCSLNIHRSTRGFLPRLPARDSSDCKRLWMYGFIKIFSCSTPCNTVLEYGDLSAIVIPVPFIHGSQCLEWEKREYADTINNLLSSPRKQTVFFYVVALLK